MIMRRQLCIVCFHQYCCKISFDCHAGKSEIPCTEIGGWQQLLYRQCFFVMLPASPGKAFFMKMQHCFVQMVDQGGSLDSLKRLLQIYCGRKIAALLVLQIY